MALDALINPANPSYSLFFPSTPDDHGRGYEGYQYLGAGLILLVVTAIGAAILRRRAISGGGEPAPLADLRWLLPAYAVLTLLAISHGVLLQGQLILLVPLPSVVIDALDLVRASGRLFWPVAYTIIYAALLIVFRLERRTLVLGAALVLQIADLSPMFAAIRPATLRAAQPETYMMTRDPRWQAVIASAAAIEMQPPDPFRDLQLIEEIGWRAMLACRPMRHMYVSRVPTLGAGADRGGSPQFPGRAGRSHTALHPLSRRRPRRRRWHHGCACWTASRSFRPPRPRRRRACAAEGIGTSQARRSATHCRQSSSGESHPMTSLSRREALAAATIASLAAAMPVWALDAAAPPPSGAAWDLTEIYPNDAAWDAARKQALAAIPGLKQFHGKLGESADTLAKALVAGSDLGPATVARIYVYASLKGR